MSKKQSKQISVKKQLSPEHISSMVNTENMGTAMMQSAQQMFLAVEEVLKTEFDFKPDQLQHFERTITRMMETLAYLEERGLSVQTIDAMGQVAKTAAHIAEIRKGRLQEDQKQIIAPTKSDIKKITS